MTPKNNPLGLAALAGLALCWAPMVTAQEPDEAEPRPSDEPKLEEIVVTAQKRAEDIRDVPLSVSAIGGETLRERAVESLDELATYTPNTTITTHSGVNFIRMRGLGSGVSKALEQSVGFIVDGVYYGRPDYMSIAMLDLAQVEVMRGPQGTLLGKNMVAGAISLTTSSPDYEWGTDLSLALGEYNKQTVTGMVTGPIVQDVLAFRIAAQRDRMDGVVKNAHTGTDQLNTQRDTIRAKLSFDGLDNLSVIATVEHALIKQRNWGFDVYQATDQHVMLYQQFNADFDADGTDRVNYTDQDRPGRKTVTNVSLKADYDIGGFTITSVSAYSQLAFVNDSLDIDYGPAPILSIFGDNDFKQWSQELRVVSPLGEIDYVAGLYFFGTDYDQTGIVHIGRELDVLAIAGQTLLPDALLPIITLLPNLTGPLTVDSATSTATPSSFSAAAFGQLRWNITDALAVMLGLRYTYETKQAHVTNSFAGTGILFMQFLDMEEYDRNLERTEHDLSPKLSATYALNDDINVYATFAQAFKGGGFNASANSADELQFEPEYANTYEVGLKGEFFGGAVRVNTALFYTAFKDLQVSVYDGTKIVISNAATATTKGFELDAMGILARGLIVHGSLGYTHARYDSYPDAPCPAGQDGTCDLSGRELDRAPSWTGSIGVSYAVPLGQWPMQILVGGDANYQGAHYTDSDLDPASFQDGYVTFNARLGLMDIDGIWQVQLNAKNLTDEMPLLLSSDVPLQQGGYAGTFGPPRTLSGEVRVRF